MAKKAKKAHMRSQKEHIVYHTGQMAFIGAIILVIMLVVSIAKAQGY